MSQSARSTAVELVRNIDLRGRTAIVTGATSGIGMETARALAAAGAELIMPSRNIEFGSAVADRLITDTGNAKIRIYEMDLADVDSVRRFADNVLSDYGRLDILVNNAGIMAHPLARTEQGFEMHFAVNYLGHFLLTASLASALAAAGDCRVVSLSASAHQHAAVDLDDLHFEARPYDKWQAYAQSKTANALFSLALNQQLRACGGLALAVNPGPAMTKLYRYLREEELRSGGLESMGMGRGLRSPLQAAASTVWAATAPNLTALGGGYCEDCRVAKPAGKEQGGGVHSHARDAATARALWDLSERLVDQQFLLPQQARRKALG